MKLEPRRIEAYLADPGLSRAALVYGEDSGLVRARVRRLIVAVAGSIDDPFRVTSLSRDMLSLLRTELTAQSMTGGRRVVHVSDVTDAASAVVQRALSQPTDGYLIVEAAGLAAKSKLRVLFETEPDVASIVCYQIERGDARALFIKALQEQGVTIEADALSWAEQRLSQDSARVRADAALLALFVHPAQTALLADVVLCLGETASITVEDLVHAAIIGDLPQTDRALDAALQEGATPVGILTVALGHVTRLHRCAILVRSGMSPADAMRGLRPPVFYRRQDAFMLSLSRWSVERLANAAAILGAAEFACKQTGGPAELLVRDVMTRLALHAARSLSRSSRSAG